MTYVKWGLIALFWLLVAAFFHYTLPQHDIVRVTDTYEKRVNFGENSIFWANADTGEAQGVGGRDVFFIQARRPNDRPIIYRNEDTGWGWPPYFKFNTANLQADAADLRSTQDDPRWVVVTHYGWRLEILSIYPNAVGIRPASGPDARVIPWVSIAILVFSAAVFWAIWVRWRRFRRARIDPMLEDVGDSMADVSDDLAARRRRLRNWWKGSAG